MICLTGFQIISAKVHIISNNKVVLKEKQFPLNEDNSILKIYNANMNYILVLPEQKILHVSDMCMIFNGTYSEYLTLDCHNLGGCVLHIFDFWGNHVETIAMENGLNKIKCPCGGRVTIIEKKET